MPKLNWSSPKDATWINGGSLKCTTAGDVYLLLKSSDFVAFDLEHAWEGLAGDECCQTGMRCGTADDAINLAAITPPESPTTSQHGETNEGGEHHAKNGNGSTHGNEPRGFAYELVLRKWCNLHPSMEFRCFVYDHELVAISQRHPSKRYPHLQPPADGSIAALLSAFFETYVQHRFARGKVHRYVVDLYLDNQERGWIVDFNVWGARTDGLLFDWSELATLGARACEGARTAAGTAPAPEMRVATTTTRALAHDPLSSYRGPTDALELLAGGGAGGGPGFEDFMQQCVRPSEMD